MSVPGDAVPTENSTPTPAEAEAPVSENIDDLSEEQLDNLFEQQANASEPDHHEEPEAPKPTQAQVEDELGDGGETPPEVKSEPESEAESQKTVPLAALHEERAKRKELAADKARMEQRFDQLMARLGPQPGEAARPEVEEPPAIVPLEENPIGHFDGRMAEIEARQKAQAERDAAVAQQNERSGQMQQVVNAYRQDFSRVVGERPELQEGYNKWTTSRVAEIQAGGATYDQAKKLLEQEETAAVIHALQQGESPAERVYAIVKARGHFSAPASADPAALPDNSGPDPEVIERGQRRASGTPGGGSAPVADTLEALANMTDDDFEKNWDRIMSQGG